MEMKKLLGKNITEPPGLPDPILQYRLLDVFTAASDNDMREEVLMEFCKKDSTLQLLIASTAFGLGVDCMDISRIINYGTPSTLEELVQEIWRAGRNDCSGKAILYHRVVKITTTAKAYGRTKLCATEHFYSKISYL